MPKVWSFNSTSDCKGELKSLRCAVKHIVKSCNDLKEQAKCANCIGSDTSAYRGCPAYQNAVSDQQKQQKQEKKYSSAIAKKDSRNAQSITTTKMTVLAADVLIKITSND